MGFISISRIKRNERGKEGRRKINRALLKGVIVCVCKQEKKVPKRNFGKTFCDAYTKDKTIKLEKKSSTSFSKISSLSVIYSH